VVIDRRDEGGAGVEDLDQAGQRSVEQLCDRSIQVTDHLATDQAKGCWRGRTHGGAPKVISRATIKWATIG
jgi:hypothetical protein